MINMFKAGMRKIREQFKGIYEWSDSATSVPGFEPLRDARIPETNF